MNTNLLNQSDELQKLASATIMIVDDEPINIDVVQTFLEQDGYSRFVTEEDSRNALSILESTRPDLLLLDLDDARGFGFRNFAAGSQPCEL